MTIYCDCGRIHTHDVARPAPQRTHSYYELPCTCGRINRQETEAPVTCACGRILQGNWQAPYVTKEKAR